MRYLVDTDWVIDYIRNRQPVKRILDELLAEGVGISAMSVAELRRGIPNAPDPEAERRNIDLFIEDSEDVLTIDAETCLIYLHEKNRLRRAGMSIDDPDLLIAAAAMRHDLTLLTNNRAHFERVAGLDFISAR